MTDRIHAWISAEAARLVTGKSIRTIRESLPRRELPHVPGSGRNAPRIAVWPWDDPPDESAPTMLEWRPRQPSSRVETRSVPIDPLASLAIDVVDELDVEPGAWDEVTKDVGPPSIKIEPREEPTPFAHPPVPIYSGGAYVYDGERYIFTVSTQRGPFSVERDTIRALVRAYSNSHGGASIDELARRFAWPRACVVEVLRAMRKTHTSLGVTDEELAETPEDQLVVDELRAKENRVVVAAERKRWEEVKRKAEQAERWEHFVGDKLRSIIRDEGVEPPPRPPLIRMQGTREEIVVLTHATDLHFGKTGWRDETGDEYGRAITCERLMDLTSDVMQRAARNGRIVSTVTACGGDWFHIDTPDGRTTRGTPQDTDGTLARIYLEGCALMRDHMNVLRQFTPRLVVRAARSNHAENLDLFANHWLAEVYAQAPDVDIIVSPLMRQYVLEGGNLIGISHGHSTKDGELSSLMAAEAPRLWGAAAFRIWALGHLHTHIVDDKRGTMQVHLPSASGTDRWHHAEGWVKANKGMGAYCLHRAGGVAAYVVSNVGGPRVASAA